MLMLLRMCLRFYISSANTVLRFRSVMLSLCERELTYVFNTVMDMVSGNRMCAYATKVES